jgi:phytoene dehydrogenase-like protein
VRALVIGAGHNGLVAAGRLALAGVETTVLEHAPHPGGATSSSETTLPGFVHDHCAGFVPMTVASPVMRALDLETEGLEWVRPPLIMAHPFADGTAIGLHHALEPTVASLEAAAPGAGARWRELIERVGPHGRALVESVVHPLPPVRNGLRLAAGLRTDLLELSRLMLGSVEAFGLTVLGAPRPAAWLASSAMHSGLPPTTAGSGAFGFLLQLMAHTHGWPYPRGGMGELAAALVRRAERLGAQVRCDAHVEEILVSDGRARGVRLRGGETLAADAVLTTMSLKPLLELLPPGAFGDRLMRRLRRWRYGTAAFKLDYALEAPVPWTAEAPRSAAVVQVAGELEDLARAAQDGHRGAVPDEPALVVGQHSLLDPTRAPDGKHTLYVYAHVPSEYEEGDDEVAGRIEAQLERFAPGFGATVLARHVRPPAQSEAENPSIVGGDLSGGSYELDQQLIFRPSPELSRYRTPVAGLYVAGASTHPGGAVHGVSGDAAARAVLRGRWRPGRRRAGSAAG